MLKNIKISLMETNNRNPLIEQNTGNFIEGQLNMIN